MIYWKKNDSAQEQTPPSSNSRRNFLKYSGVGLAATGLMIAGCDDDDDIDLGDLFGTVNLGSGDVGILNYAYALEQLEAAFYTKVLTGSYFASADPREQEILRDLELHERAHRDFFKAAIGTVAEPIPELAFDFSSVDFSSRSSVLATAKTFEDLGVSAYNGAGKLISNPAYLVVAGKIVSVEARHASIIRCIFDSDPTSFAGDSIVDINGLDLAMTPQEVLAAADPFFINKINASNLPG